MILGGRIFKNIFQNVFLKDGAGRSTWDWEFHTAARATWLPLFSLIICTFLKHSNLTLIHYIKKHQFTFWSCVTLLGNAVKTQLRFLVNSMKWNEEEEKHFLWFRFILPLGFLLCVCMKLCFRMLSDCRKRGHAYTTHKHSSPSPVCHNFNKKRQNCVIMPLVSSTWSLRFPSTYFSRY